MIELTLTDGQKLLVRNDIISFIYTDEFNMTVVELDYTPGNIITKSTNIVLDTYDVLKAKLLS